MKLIDYYVRLSVPVWTIICMMLVKYIHFWMYLVGIPIIILAPPIYWFIEDLIIKK